MTLAAWVFPTAHGNGVWRNVIIKERTAGEVYNLYSNVDTNVPTAYVIRGAAPAIPLDARGTVQLPLNAWTHLATTHDGTTLRLYVNSVEVGSRTVAGALLTSTGALRIGGNSAWGEFFQGLIDEIRVHNRALSPAEVQTIMTLPLAP
jgi:Concanavalin A-like lectin/glucanases superfamily